MTQSKIEKYIKCCELGICPAINVYENGIEVEKGMSIESAIFNKCLKQDVAIQSTLKIQRILLLNGFYHGNLQIHKFTYLYPHIYLLDCDKLKLREDPKKIWEIKPPRLNTDEERFCMIVECLQNLIDFPTNN